MALRYPYMTEYLFKLTPADLSVLDRALQEAPMPLRMSLPLLNKINAQIQAQQTPPEEPQE